jgi:hypothetical protein
MAGAVIVEDALQQSRQLLKRLTRATIALATDSPQA